MAVMQPGERVSFNDLLGRVNDHLGSDAKEKSLRGTLPRMQKAGQVVRVGRGVYALPENAETPVSAEVSDGNTPRDQEGGGTHETTQSKTSSAAEDNYHPQLGASIAEVAS